MPESYKPGLIELEDVVERLRARLSRMCDEIEGVDDGGIRFEVPEIELDLQVMATGDTDQLLWVIDGAAPGAWPATALQRVRIKLKPVRGARGVVKVSSGMVEPE